MSWGVGESTWDVAVSGVLSVHGVVVVHRLLLLPGRRHGVPEAQHERTTMKRWVPLFHFRGFGILKIRCKIATIAQKVNSLCLLTPNMFIFYCYYCLFMVRFIMS